MTSKFLHIIMVLLMMGGNGIWAQNRETLQVFTKTITKRIDYSQKELLSLEAEKAQISVSGWKKNYIDLTIKLISKHKKAETAKKDLNYLYYNLTEKQDTIKLSNFFKVPSSTVKIKSNLITYFELKVPHSIACSIKLLYGELTLENLSGNHDIQLNFGQLKMTDMGGSLVLKSNYGDVLGQNVNFDFTSTAQKANIELKDASGKYDITSEYGEIAISSISSLNGVNINGKNTAVVLQVASFEEFNYSISTSYADIILPTVYNSLIDNKILQKKRFDKSFDITNPKITINTSFSNIQITSLANFSKK